ncbi:EspA/EspE family type VII secretion system effector [Mycolicibacterium alvei]|nr:EspA/EspE family type VII secretion system effector [Mycolicibacterium alvei]MCV6998807.1 hypothetical protein [Mycolicibacterium alvei]
MGLLGEIADFGKGVIESNLKWTERAAKAGSRLIRAARSPILVAGQQTIASMKSSTGVGDPENGQRFDAGADTMGEVGQVLVSAFPDDSWDSNGASAYAGRNSEQVGRVQTMLGLDTMVAEVLSTEAGQIAATRDNLDGHSDWLGAMSLLTTSAGIVPGFGTAAQMTAEFAMVAKAVGDSNNDLRTLCGHIDENAAVLQNAAAQYQSLAGGATLTGAEFEPPAGDPEVSAPGDSGATDPGVPTGGGDVPSGGGGSVPSTGGGGGTRPGSASGPGMPTDSSGMGAPPSDAAANAAGALGGILGSLVSPLSGILGGISQAVGQAVQAATQAGTQAAQMAGSTAGLADAAEIDKASGVTGLDVADEGGQDDANRDGRDEDDEKNVEDREKGDGEEQVGEPEEGEVGDVPDTDSAGGPADPLGVGADDEAAKTLPPDLEATAAGSVAAGPAPVHVGADFEQGQLRVAAAATLDRGVPGSAAVIDR